jgi:multidrug efflux pump subunit AcrB
MANVFVPFPGASAKDVEALVARPAEQVLSRIAGIEHVYSVSRPGMAVITVQFEVGEDPSRPWCGSTTPSIRTRTGSRPTSAWLEPIIKPKGIDDVPIVTLTCGPAIRREVGLRDAAGGACRRDRPQAHPRHPRRGHHRRPRPRDPRA